LLVIVKDGIGDVLVQTARPWAKGPDHHAQKEQKHQRKHPTVGDLSQ
jgi:hypothetical protein